MTALIWYEVIDFEEDTATKYPDRHVKYSITWTLTKLAYLDRIPQDTVTWSWELCEAHGWVVVEPQNFMYADFMPAVT